MVALLLVWTWGQCALGTLYDSCHTHKLMPNIPLLARILYCFSGNEEREVKKGGHSHRALYCCAKGQLLATYGQH